MNLCDFPLCRDCAVTQPTALETECPACRDASLPELLLCELNRCVQTPETFVCDAFRPPRLRVFQGGKSLPTGEEPREANGVSGYSAERMKYLWACSVQKLRNEPQAVIIMSRYHLIWNTRQRRPVLQHRNTLFERMNQAFLADSPQTGGTAALVHLASDHVHVFAESDGTRPVDAIVRALKKTGETAWSQWAEQSGVPPLPIGLWDRAYYATTVPPSN